MPMDRVFEKIEVMSLEDQGDGERLMRKLLHFNYKNAHCYDPNEEARLKKTIETIGGENFNSRVRELAERLLSTKRPETHRFSRAVGVRHGFGAGRQGRDSAL